MFQEVLRGHVEHEVGVHLSTLPDQLSVICLSRCDGPDFDERDKVVLRLLRPHLDAAMRRLANPAPRLTSREAEVLRCVRDGCSNIQVARRLGVTEATVEKHLENVFARIGAHSRVQALNLCATILD
jgi:DNA-binding NarL/FixJ family response regulator